MKHICVFAGAGSGRLPEYSAAAAELGRLLAANSLTLVYGGGSTGLMGVVADAALAAGGRVIGVIPESLTGIEVDHKGLSRMIVTADMHERKAEMHRLSDAFVALPGGVGTFDELFEALCWAQLGFHKKPCALLNAGGYYDPLLRLMRNAVDEGFTDKKTLGLLITAPAPGELLAALRGKSGRRKT